MLYHQNAVILTQYTIYMGLAQARFNYFYNAWPYLHKYVYVEVYTLQTTKAAV